MDSSPSRPAPGLASAFGVADDQDTLEGDPRPPLAQQPGHTTEGSRSRDAGEKSARLPVGLGDVEALNADAGAEHAADSSGARVCDPGHGAATVNGAGMDESSRQNSTLSDSSLGRMRSALSDGSYSRQSSAMSERQSSLMSEPYSRIDSIPTTQAEREQPANTRSAIQVLLSNLRDSCSHPLETQEEHSAVVVVLTQLRTAMHDKTAGEDEALVNRAEFGSNAGFEAVATVVGSYDFGAEEWQDTTMAIVQVVSYACRGSPTNRDSIHGTGLLSSLASGGLGSPSHDLRYRTMFALVQACDENPANQLQVGQLPGVLSMAVECLAVKHEGLLQFTVYFLNICCEEESNVKVLTAEPNATSILSVLAEHGPTHLVRHARKLMNLCGVMEEDWGALQPAGWRQLQPEMCGLLVALPTSRSASEDLKRLRELMDRSAAGSEKVAHDNREAFASLGGCKILMSLADEMTRSAEDASKVVVRLLMCLQNACKRCNANKHLLRTEGVLEWCVSKLELTTDVNVQQACLYLIALACERTKPNQELIGRSSAFPRTFQLLSSDVVLVQDFATYLLRECCCTDVRFNQQAVRDSKAAAPLLAVLASVDTKTISRQARDVLRSCGYSEPWDMLERQGWAFRRPEAMSLVDKLDSLVDAQSQAVTEHLAELSQAADADTVAVQAAFRAGKGFDKLIRLLEPLDQQEYVSEDSLTNSIAVLLNHVCKGCEDNCKLLRTSGLLEWLVERLRSKSIAVVVQNHLVVALSRSVEACKSNCELVGSLGAIPVVVDLLTSKSETIQDYGTYFLQLCCTDTASNCKRFRDSENAAPLVAVLEHEGSTDVSQQANAVLRACDYPQHDWPSLRSQGLALFNAACEVALQALRTAPTEFVQDKLVAVDQLLDNRGAKEVFVQGGICASISKALQLESHVCITALRLLCRLLDSTPDLTMDRIRSDDELLAAVAAQLRQPTASAVILAAAEAVALYCCGCVDTIVLFGVDLHGLQLLNSLLMSTEGAIQEAVVQALGAVCSDPQTLIHSRWKLDHDSLDEHKVTAVKQLGGDLSLPGSSVSVWVFWIHEKGNGRIFDVELHKQANGKFQGHYTVRMSEEAGTVGGDMVDATISLKFASATNAQPAGMFYAQVSTSDVRLEGIRTLINEANLALNLALLAHSSVKSRSTETSMTTAATSLSAKAELVLHALGYCDEDKIHELYLTALVWQGKSTWEREGSVISVEQHPKEATVQDVCLWLCGNNFERYAGLFDKFRITGELLLQLTDEELKQDFEVTDIRDRKRLRQTIEKLGAFLGRYRFRPGRVTHSSHTSIVLFATDLDMDSEVALKFMRDKEQYGREIQTRRLGGTETDRGRLDPEYVIDVLNHYELDEDASLIDPRLRGKYVLVMEKAERDMTDSLAHDGVAGRDRESIVRMLHDVISALLYFNDQLSHVHGDVKPRNFVETISNGKSRWKAIDLDAAVAHNSQLSSKCSTGFISTEIARALLHQDGPESIAAAAGHDMFAAGMLLFQLCSEDGSSLFFCNQADNLVEHDNLIDLATRWNVVKHKKLLRVPWADARDLCLWMLQDEPMNRPPNFATVLQHPFLAGGDAIPLRFPSYRGLTLPHGQLYHFFLSHNQKEAGDVAHTLFETLAAMGLSIWYDMDAKDLTEDGMAAGVRESIYFLLIVTTNVFQRPFCRREMDEALTVGKQFVYIQEQDPRFSAWSWDTWSSSAEFEMFPWVHDQTVAGPYAERSKNESLWGTIKTQIASDKTEMLPYRRRQFEATAMIMELLRRCCIIEDLHEPHPAVHHASIARNVLPTGKLFHILITHGSQFGTETAKALSVALQADGFAVQLAEPALAAFEEQLSTCCATLVLLTKGIIAEPTSVARLLAVLSAGTRLVLVYVPTTGRAAHGWEFYGPEQRSAPDQIQEMLKNNEAITYREGGSYEAVAFIEEIGRRAKGEVGHPSKAQAQRREEALRNTHTSA